MRSREELIAAVREHNGQAGSAEDAAKDSAEGSVGFTTAQGLADATELAATTDPTDDFAAAYLLGWFHWSRFQSLPDGANQDDLEAALRFFAPVHAAEPQAVPEELRDRYRQPDPVHETPDEPPTREPVDQTSTRPTAEPPGADPLVLAQRAIRLIEDHARTGNPDRLAEALSLLRTAVATSPVGHPERAAFQSVLGSVLQTSFERTGEISVLHEAVATCREAVAGMPVGHPSHAGVHSLLGSALHSLFERTGDRATLTEAIRAGRAAVRSAGTGHPQRGQIASHFAGTLLLASLAGEAGALAEAVEVNRTAVAATPPGSPNRAGILSNLGIALHETYIRSGDPKILMEGTSVLREAVAIATADDPQRANYLTNLGSILLLRFQRDGDVAVAREAVEVCRAAIAATPADDPRRGKYLTNLANALKELSDRTGETTTLTEAIDTARTAVDTLRPGHSDRASALSVLGAALRVLSSRNGDLDTQREAVTFLKAAVAATPTGAAHRATYLSNLGNALRDLFGRTGDTAVLAEALEAGRAAVPATATGSVDAAANLSNLGVTLRFQYGRTHDVETLREAVTIHREAVAVAPLDHPKRAHLESNLGNVLRALYQQTGETDLLTEAIDVLRSALRRSPADHPDHVALLTNLATALQSLAVRARDVGAFREAVAAGRAAVAATPADRFDRAKHLANLGASLQMLYLATDDPSVQREAVAVSRAAVAALPADHPDLASFQSNLGLALQRLIESAPDETDIRVLIEAADIGRAAVAATPPDHPDRTVRLVNLGSALRMLSEHTGDPAPLSEAARCLGQAADNTSAQVDQRINAYCELADLAPRTDAGPAGALAAIEGAVALLPRMAPRALIRPDREHRLSLLATLAGQAAAVAVGAGRPDRAVELLEQTRGILVADILDARSSDLTRLREAAPELARDFEELRTRIDVLDRTDLSGSPGTDPLVPDHPDLARRAARELAAERREAITEWDHLLNQIRSLTGFETFLQPPAVGDLAAQAESGPVVLVYGHGTRCDALVLRAAPHPAVQVVPLAGLDQEGVEARAERLEAAQRVTADGEAEPMERITAQAEIRDILAWLWDTVAEPVLAALGIPAGPEGDDPDWPRLWWCPVGVFARLPLHAAGHHADVAGPDGDRRANPRTVLDRAVSSYTPTIRGLAYARSHRPDPATDTTETTVIIAVPEAPGVEPLSGVAAEAEDLAALIPGAELLPDPRRPSVLAALRDHKVAHFACHGQVDRDNPAAGRLILDDHLTAPLTVADISALHLTSSLAYLSACSTAVTNLVLSNEAVHLTGAFHLAGYRHVIGTLWPITDNDARGLAIDFYTGLTGDGTTPPDTTRSARVLHDAVRRLRDRYPSVPTAWAAHTHTGS